MDYYGQVSKIYYGAAFNPACFKYTEEVAREKKLWNDVRPMPTQEQLDVAQLEMGKELEVTAKYDSMQSAIYDEMERVFGTRKPESVNASATIWDAMLKRPANYVSVNLGLVDEAAVMAYATNELNKADAYGLFIMERRAQFQAEKAAINS